MMACASLSMYNFHVVIFIKLQRIMNINLLFATHMLDDQFLCA